MTVLLIAVGAAVGAPLRYLVDKRLVGWILRGTTRPFPWGTLIVNVLGSFVLGLVVSVDDRSILLLAGIGFCGAFTTYSTLAAETLALAAADRRGGAGLNLVLNLGLGLLAAGLGVLLG